MNARAVVLDGANVRIEGADVLGPVDLEIGTGERWALLGPNGSGKTTLLALAGARRQPSSGSVTVLGTTLGHGKVRGLHPRISHLSHILTELLPPGITAEDVVLTGRDAIFATWFQEYGEADRRRAHGLLEEMGCAHLAARPISTGSQGERQRVLLARALFRGPELLLLDEPSAGLDFTAREMLIGAIERATAANDVTSILATHHLEEIPASTTHAALLRAGSLLTSGPIAEVLTAEGLGTCFGVPVEIGRRGGRWWAWARV